MDYLALGTRIRMARRAQSTTQSALADTVGIAVSFLGHIEHGRRKASLETLIKIANALETSVDLLLQDSLGYGLIKQPIEFSAAEAEAQPDEPTPERYTLKEMDSFIREVSEYLEDIRNPDSQ